MLIVSVLFIVTLSLFSFSIFTVSRKSTHPIPSILRKKQTQQCSSLHKNDEDRNRCSDDKAQVGGKRAIGSVSTGPSILRGLLPPDSPKWDEPFKDEGPDNKNGSVLDGGRVGDEDEEEEEEEETKKKRKKRAKKKRPDPSSACGGAGEHDRKKDNKKEELVCLYPFTTSSSAVQRKLKQNYDQLAKSHESNALTLAQVGQFVNCLVEAKKELKHRSEVIQRKFTITKALLLKADRSSFDRLHQQIYKLELEQRRLEEDAVVYNWLQQQLKVSSAYKKLLEIGARMEAEDKHREQVERTDDEFADISFEELLAQEKKDAFWQRNGKSRSCSISGQRFC
ncbi:unnamed protein product [Coffea canephora]|uniref:Uncharacterized protein n=1 Tax=Coffea canephora TaxID=49390 RepID=A0A068TPE4_COFCA|nr:unnamed protein product [Coffea canephora]